MAEPTIKFNNSTGSDTQASGSALTTAVYGTNASFAGTPSVLTLDGSPDLSGVATDGTDAAWVKTTTGRQWSKITDKDNGAKTVTLADTLAGTATGRTWAIGGKRSSLDNADNRVLFGANGLKAGWTVNIENTGTNYTITTEIDIPTTGTIAAPVTITSTSGTRPTITCATNNVNIWDTAGSSYLIFDFLKFTHTAGTRGRGWYNSGSTANQLTIHNCIVDGMLRAVEGDHITYYRYDQEVVISKTEILNCTGTALLLTQTSGNGRAHVIDRAYIHDNATHGIDWVAGHSSHHPLVHRSVIADNGGSAINLGGTHYFLYVVHCNLVGNTADGLTYAGAALTNLVWDSNILWGNGGYGENCTNQPAAPLNQNNAYGSNTSGNRRSLLAGFADQTLTVSPFTSSTDYGLNETAGGGNVCRGTAPQPTNATLNTAGDIGAIESGGGTSTAAGGGPLIGGRLIF